jgi:hypothetical protein
MVRDATIRNGIVDTNILIFKLINPITNINPNNNPKPAMPK